MILDYLNIEWKNAFKDLINTDYFNNINEFLDDEYGNYTIYPSPQNVFNCFNYTSFENVKVVILGQDPYHQIGQANGLAFSVENGIKLPPSLKNIFKELENDLNIKCTDSGDLTTWAKQGVLLLNTVLTVRDSQPNSHAKCGWQKFTDDVIKLISEKDTPVVFILWGNNAISKEKLIDTSKHLVIKSAHPSPLGCYRGFWNSKPFSRTNKFLNDNNLKEIDWHI